MSKFLKPFLWCAFYGSWQLACAEPTSIPVKITEVRPYHNAGGGAGDVYVTVDSVVLCGTNIFRIPLDWGGSKQSFAIATAALLADKSVRIEINNQGCATPAWTTSIQSIYLMR